MSNDKLMNLKHQIENKNISDTFKIFIYSDNTFAVNQYIKEISKIKNLDINYSESLDNLNSDDIFAFSTDEILHVINVDKLLPPYIDVEKLNNVIVKCKSVDTSLLQHYSEYIYQFPKIESWQIHDLIKTMTHLSDNKLDWLCNCCNYSIYRLYNEALKLQLFDDSETMFNLFNIENAYIDLNNRTTFDLVNALVVRDVNTIGDIIANIEYIDIEPFAVLTLLIKQFRLVINIQTNAKATAESLNISSKQFYVVRKNCGKYSNDKLIEIYSLLTDIDYKIKSGELDSNQLIDYLIINILK